MKNKMSKTLVLGVIFIFLGASFVPVINAVSIPKNINKSNEDDKIYYFCRVDISGRGQYNFNWSFLKWTDWYLFEGQISIKSLYSTSYSNGKITFFDKFTATKGAGGRFIWFIGIKSNNPFEMHGFAIYSLAHIY